MDVVSTEMRKGYLDILSFMLLSVCDPLAIQLFPFLDSHSNTICPTVLPYPLPSNVSLHLFLQMTSAAPNTQTAGVICEKKYFQQNEENFNEGYFKMSLH